MSETVKSPVDSRGQAIRVHSEVKIGGKGVTRSVRYIESDGTLILGHVNAGNNRSRKYGVQPSDVVVTEF